MLKNRKLRDSWLLIHKIGRIWKRGKRDNLWLEVEEGHHCCIAYFDGKSGKGGRKTILIRVYIHERVVWGPSLLGLLVTMFFIKILCGLQYLYNEIISLWLLYINPWYLYEFGVMMISEFVCHDHGIRVLRIWTWGINYGKL